MNILNKKEITKVIEELKGQNEKLLDSNEVVKNVVRTNRNIIKILKKLLKNI